MPDNKGVAIRSREVSAKESVSVMNGYNDIVCIEAELSGYRRGCIRVKIDLDKKLVTWRDSQQWNNNFLRSISPDKIKNFMNLIPSTHLLQWKTHYVGLASQDEISCGHPAEWAVVISFTQKPPVRIIGSNQFPSEWRLFRDLIESITKIPFRLR